MLPCYGSQTAGNTRRRAQPLCGHDTGVNADSILACLGAYRQRKLSHRLLSDQADRERTILLASPWERCCSLAPANQPNGMKCVLSQSLRYDMRRDFTPLVSTNCAEFEKWSPDSNCRDEHFF